MVTCSVKCCGNTQNNRSENCTFHRFPKDRIERGKWLTLIGRVGWNPTNSSTICSKHFPSKFIKKVEKRTVLVKGALPNLFVPGCLKERVPSSYVYRDIPSTSQEQQERTSVLQSSSTKNLFSTILKLKQKLQAKQKIIRRLAAKSKRQALKIILLQDVLKEIHSRPGLKEHYNDIITMACSNDLLQNLINRVNDD